MAVLPFISLASLSAPTEMRYFTISRCPSSDAKMRGVDPYLFLASLSAPIEMRY